MSWIINKKVLYFHNHYIYMKYSKFVFLLILLCFIVGTASATDYYVNNTGDNGAAGTSEGTAWDTITYAATQATSPGDTVHIKGGNYGGEHVVFGSSGNSGSPITFQAYDGEALIDGGDQTGYGLYASGEAYITLSGFNVTDYQFGILAPGSNHIIINDSVVWLNYVGLRMGDSTGHNHTISNVTAYNNELHGISMRFCSDTIIEDCYSYSVDGLGEYTDYGYYIFNSSNNNIIRDCVAGDGVKPLAHGVAFRYESNHNQVINCTSNYTSNEHFKTSEDSEYNVFTNCSGYGFNQDGTGYSFGFKSSNNTAINCRGEGNTHGGYVYYSGSESTTSPVEGNVFENCVFVNNTNGIFIYDYVAGGGEVGDTIIKNCIVTNNTDGIQVDAGIQGTVTISYNDVWGNTNDYVGSASAGTGDISSDPLFADYDNLDFHLKSEYGRWTGTTWTTDVVSSPCIDVGDPSDDYSNEPAGNGDRINMGTYGNTIYASKSVGAISSMDSTMKT